MKAVLSALGLPRTFAVVLEDLHWADAATLDLVEYLLARRVSIPLVATWRSEETTVPDATADWCARVRRPETVHTLSLGPLTREETAEQIAMLLPGSSPVPVPTPTRSSSAVRGCRCSPSSWSQRPKRSSQSCSASCSTGG